MPTAKYVRCPAGVIELQPAEEAVAGRHPALCEAVRWLGDIQCGRSATVQECAEFA